MSPNSCSQDLLQVECTERNKCSLKHSQRLVDEWCNSISGDAINTNSELCSSVQQWMLLAVEHKPERLGLAGKQRMWQSVQKAFDCCRQCSGSIAISLAQTNDTEDQAQPKKVSMVDVEHYFTTCLRNQNGRSSNDLVDHSQCNQKQLMHHM